jgi:hypothetical protein
MTFKDALSPTLIPVSFALFLVHIALYRWLRPRYHAQDAFSLDYLNTVQGSTSYGNM